MELGGSRRKGKTPSLDPLAKQRKALEKKAEGGDVYAIRELRENAEYWYGQAGRQDALAAMNTTQLEAVRAICEDALAGRSSAWLEACEIPPYPV